MPSWPPEQKDVVIPRKERKRTCLVGVPGDPARWTGDMEQSGITEVHPQEQVGGGWIDMSQQAGYSGSRRFHSSWQEPATPGRFEWK